MSSYDMPHIIAQWEADQYFFPIDEIHPEALKASSRFSLYTCINNIYSAGENLRLSRNAFNQAVDIITADIDKKHQIPYFGVVLKDGCCIKVTK